MKTADEFLAEAEFTIAHVHHRTNMYVGSASQPGASDRLEGLFWMAHWLWATIQSRQSEFRQAVDAVRESHSCGPRDLLAVFRERNPAADESAACQFVLEFWAEVDTRLQIDFSEVSLRER